MGRIGVCQAPALAGVLPRARPLRCSSTSTPCAASCSARIHSKLESEGLIEVARRAGLVVVVEVREIDPPEAE